jgi:glycosyltransferase involved in cell wall biosynthesis
MYKLPDWQFDIVGDGDAYVDLKNQIEVERIPRIKLYGRQVPNEYYKRSPIYIMTSENEGFPNTLIEAQSYAAVPIVYNNYPICSWLLEEGNSGILIPPFNVDKMADEIINLVNNPEKHNYLMEKALENAKKFDIKEVGKMWLRLFNEKIN